MQSLPACLCFSIWFVRRAAHPAPVSRRQTIPDGTFNMANVNMYSTLSTYRYVNRSILDRHLFWINRREYVRVPDIAELRLAQSARLNVVLDRGWCNARSCTWLRESICGQQELRISPQTSIVTRSCPLPTAASGSRAASIVDTNQYQWDKLES